jgi:hypothetical protein
MRQWACHRFHSRMNRLHQPTWYRGNRIVVLAGGRGGNVSPCTAIALARLPEGSDYPGLTRFCRHGTARRRGYLAAGGASSRTGMED